jgi:hypothetical protein
MFGSLIKKIKDDAAFAKTKPQYQLVEFLISKNNQMAKTKDSLQLGDFLKTGKVGWEIFTTRPSNNVHALCQYYKRVATCVPVKIIDGDTLTPMTKVVILE